MAKNFHEIDNLLVRLEAMLQILLDVCPVEDIIENVTKTQMIKDSELTIRELKEKIHRL